MTSHEPTQKKLSSKILGSYAWTSLVGLQIQKFSRSGEFKQLWRQQWRQKTMIWLVEWGNNPAARAAHTSFPNWTF